MRRAIVALILLALAWPAAADDHGEPPGADEPPAIDLIQPVRGPIIRHFEPPPTPFAAGHRGIDFATPAGSPVHAAAGGVVAFAGQVGGDLFVSIDHPEGLRTTYSFLEAVLVKAGQAVAQGDVIARSGPGHDGVEPPHLHFGLRRGTDYLDPEPVLLASIRRNLSRVISLAA